MLTAYVVLRCLLLATMENAEHRRYTLEAFPIILIAAIAIAPRPNAASQPLST
jgi:hypothetical protein